MSAPNADVALTPEQAATVARISTDGTLRRWVQQLSAARELLEWFSTEIAATLGDIPYGERINDVCDALEQIETDLDDLAPESTRAPSIEIGFECTLPGGTVVRWNGEGWEHLPTCPCEQCREERLVRR